MKVTIKLVDKEQRTIQEVETDTNIIAEAATISYKGNIYIYTGMSGRFFQDIKFMIANPVVID